MSSLLFDRLGPRGIRQARFASLVTAIALLGLATFVIIKLAAKGQLEAQRWAILIDPTSGVPQTLGLALLATLQAAMLGMLFSLLLGAVLAALQLSTWRSISGAASTLVELFRGVPLLLLMLFAALALPNVGLDLNVLTMVVGALVIYNSAVIAEILRAGISAINAGQKEAAEALGMRPLRILQKILLPQAIPTMTPLLISQMVILLKDTSIGYVIGYSELLRNGRSLVEFYGNRYSLQIYIAVAAIYILVNVTISAVARRMASRRPHDRTAMASVLVTSSIPVTPSGEPRRVHANRHATRFRQ